jgi:hypothetical protein
MLFECSQLLPSLIRIAANFDVAIDALSNARERPLGEHSEANALIDEVEIGSGGGFLCFLGVF